MTNIKLIEETKSIKCEINMNNYSNKAIVRGIIEIAHFIIIEFVVWFCALFMSGFYVCVCVYVCVCMCVCVCVCVCVCGERRIGAFSS